MMDRRRFPGRAAAALAFAALASLALAGCEDVLNGLLDNAAPTGLDASDGDHANSISVSWSAPNLSSDRWKDYSVDHYEVSWSWNSQFGNDDYVYSTSKIITAENAVEYSFTVRTILRTPSGGTEDGGISTDTGFAMSASTLVWYDGGGSYYAASGDTWYVTMLQEGFPYTFGFGIDNVSSIEVYPYETLDRIASAGPGSTVSWTCDSGGAGHKFYVKVSKGQSGSFTAKCDYLY